MPRPPRRASRVSAVLLLVLSVLGCGRTPVEEFNVLTLKAIGLWTFPNPLTSPDGALAEASNVVIDRPGVIEPRRGLPEVPFTFTSGGYGDAMTAWNGYLIVHTSMNKLAWIDPVTPAGWTEFSGTFLPPSGHKMKFTTANKNLYFTTNLGVYKLDLITNQPQAAGGIRALQMTGSVNGHTGFLNADNQVAYRVVWGYNDGNKNLILGAPSQRVVVNGEQVAVPTTTTGITRAATTVTVHTAAVHPFAVADVVYLASDDPDFPSGNKLVVTVADTTHFTYTEAGAAVTTSAVQNFYYASRNVSLSVTIPAGITTNWFAQVYRSAQSGGADIDPGDELSMVYEYVPQSVQIAAGGFSFIDIVPDTLRGNALYTNNSQETILQQNDPPPICTDLATFEGSMFCSATKRAQTLNLRILSTNGLTGANFVIANATHLDFIPVPITVATGGSAAQNIADTTLSLVAAINALPTPLVYAYYTSGADDPPGMFSLAALDPTTGPFYAVIETISPATPTMANTAFVPTVPSIVGLPGGQLSRTGTTVTATATALTGGYDVDYVVGQQIYLSVINDTADAAFPVGIKTVTGVTAHAFTYTEAGAATVSVADYASAAQPVTNASSTQMDEPNGVAISKIDQPEAIPAVNQLFVGTAIKEVSRILPLRGSLWAMKADGLYRLTGNNPGNYNVELFDGTCIVSGPETAVATSNQIIANTNQGVVAITETGVEVLSRAIEGELLALPALARTAFETHSFGVAYDSDRKYLLWTISQTQQNYAAQAYTYNLLTHAWSKWAIGARAGVVEPTTDQLFTSTIADSADESGFGIGRTVRKENKSRTILDYHDGRYPLTVISAAGRVLTFASVAGIAPGDTISSGTGLSPTYIDVVTAVDLGASTVTTASVNWTPFVSGSVFLFKGYPLTVTWLRASFGEPEKLKQVRGGEVMLDSGAFATAKLTFLTDLTPYTSAEDVNITGTSGLATSVTGSRPIAFPVPQEKQLCGQFTIGFTMTNALGGPIIAGMGLQYRIAGNRPSR